MHKWWCDRHGGAVEVIPMGITHDLVAEDPMAVLWVHAVTSHTLVCNDGLP